jgi:acetate CoA/acetoacetate CoA-transferase beta subunit
MDLVSGAKKVIVAMTHSAKGKSKILKRCTLPLTSVRRVDMVVTELAVLEPTEAGLVLKEVAPGVTVEQVIAATEATLIIPAEVAVMAVSETNATAAKA